MHYCGPLLSKGLLPNHIRTLVCFRTPGPDITGPRHRSLQALKAIYGPTPIDEFYTLLHDGWGSQNTIWIERACKGIRVLHFFCFENNIYFIHNLFSMEKIRYAPITGRLGIGKIDSR